MNEAIRSAREAGADLSSPAIDDDRFRSIESWTWVDGTQPYVVCAFFTPTYRGVAEKLHASLKRLKINHHFGEAQQQNTWEAGTRLKPHFISRCLRVFPDRDIFYLDSDAVVQSRPKFFENIKTDVAILFTPMRVRGRHLLKISAGTLYIRNTPGGRQFVEHWCKQDKRAKPLTNDEDMIYMAFDEFEGITFTAMPRSYSKVFDSPGPDPVIEHFQESRKQFRLGRVLRKTRQVSLVVLIVALIGWLIWYQFGT